MPAAAVYDEPSTSTTTSFCRRDDGKFAHVVFRSHRDMKRTLRILTEIMAGTKVVADEEEEQHDNDDTNQNSNNAVTMDPVELQTLADVESNNDDASASNTPVLTGIRAVAARYRATGCRHSTQKQQRAALLKECNRVMKQWEEE